VYWWRARDGYGASKIARRLEKKMNKRTRVAWLKHRRKNKRLKERRRSQKAQQSE
jgi:hypothetical protein